jgi:hypothetical protein
MMTPLQIQHYLWQMLEQAHRFGEKPVTPTIVNATLAPDIHALEPTLAATRSCDSGTDIDMNFVAPEERQRKRWIVSC